MTDSPPSSSTRIGWAASATAVSAANAASSTAYARPEGPHGPARERRRAACRRGRAGSPLRTGPGRPSTADRAPAPPGRTGRDDRAGTRSRRSPRRRCWRTGKTAVTRNSQPSGLRGWRRATTIPTARAGDADDHGHDPVAELPREQRQREHHHQGQRGQPAQDRGPDRGRRAHGGGRLIHGHTLRPDRSGNVTAARCAHMMRSQLLASQRLAGPGHPERSEPPASPRWNVVKPGAHRTQLSPVRGRCSVRGAAQPWNCAASVEPARATVSASGEIACVIRSK